MLYTVDVNDFYAKIGPVETNIPWGRPDFQTLKFFLNYIKNNSDIFERYEIYLIGKVLFNWDTWDVDLLIVNDFKSRFQLSLIFTLFFSMALIAWASIYNLKHQFNYKNFDSISEKIKSVQINLIKQINNRDQIITTQQAELILNDLSSTFFTDINLFDAKGKLITTSQKKIFETDLISKQMHPNTFN